MAMNDGKVLFPAQGWEKVERQKIATHRDQLPLALAWHPKHRHKRTKTLNPEAVAHERVIPAVRIQPGTVHHGFNSIFTKAAEHALQSRLGSAPLCRVEFSEDMGDAHGC